MWELPDTSDVLVSFGTLLAGAAAIWGAATAHRGLSTWKTQSVWQADNELARRIMIDLYRYRDSLYAVRHPAIYSAEMELDDEDSNNLNEQDKRRQGVINAYVKRWRSHYENKNELDTVLLEADAVWGNELSQLVKALKELEHELNVYIQLHLDAHYRGDNDLARQHRDILAGERDILYDRLNDDKDEFRKDFQAALGPVESLLKTKLGRV